MDAMILQEDFKRLVEARLRELNWTRADLARAMGRSRQYVHTYLNGDASAGFDVTEKFFEALGCTIRLQIASKKVPKESAASVAP